MTSTLANTFISAIPALCTGMRSRKVLKPNMAMTGGVVSVAACLI